jgi:KTSC domain
VGYDPAKRQLFIQFPSAMWRYLDVPASIHDGLVAAESKGTFYAKSIKGRFPSEAVAAAQVQDTVAASEAQRQAADASAAADAAMRAKPMVKGNNTARASGLRTYWYAELIDYDAAVAHYKTQPEVRDVVAQLANQDARKLKNTGATIPGIVIKSRQE